MKFKLLFIFTLFFSLLPLCAMYLSRDSLNKKLTKAIKRGNIEQVKLCLLRGAKATPHKKFDRFFYHPLIKAAKYGHTEIVKILFDYHADVNAKDDDKRTALMRAASSGHIEIVKILLDYHAIVNAKDEDKRTALIYAASSGHTNIVKLLLDYDAIVDAKDEDRYTALIYAASSGHIEIVKLLLDYHAIVDTRNNHGRTALMFAAGHGHAEIVKILLAHNVDINITDINYYTALHHAMLGDQPTIVNILLKHSSITNAYQHSALIFGGPKAIKPLLKHIFAHARNNPEIWHLWDQYILSALNASEYEWQRLRIHSIKTINALRILLHHADKLPLSRKKLEFLTTKSLGERHFGVEAFRETVKHLRTHAF